jgi:hypothetical protein
MDRARLSDLISRKAGPAPARHMKASDVLQQWNLGTAKTEKDAAKGAEFKIFETVRAS